MSRYSCISMGRRGIAQSLATLFIVFAYSVLLLVKNMGKTYIQIGTYNDNSQDYHKEMTINVSGNTSVTDLVRNFFAEDVQAEEVPTADIPLFKYIHPCITDDKEKRKIHGEVANLVQTLPLPEICRYMRQMYKEKRIYLNVKIEAMFDELHRMGLPDEETPGYSLKNFQNYFNMND